MSRVAIVSANRDICRFLELELYMLGYTCDVYKSSFSVPHGVYDLIIADMQVTKEAEAEAFDCTAAFIGEAEHEDLDDGKIYLTWPVAIEDIHKLLEGVTDNADKQKKSTSMNLGVYNTAYTVDGQNGIFSFGDRYIKLTKNELAVLRALCEAEGKVVKREIIMNILGADKGNIADVYICNIRKKLEGDGGQRLIFTERGKGYRTTLCLI